MKRFRFGVCCRPGQVAAAAAAGYDYIELNLNDVLKMSEDQYREMAREMQRCGVYAEVVHGLLGEDAVILGEGVSSREIHRALDVRFDLAQALGAEIAVFDFPAARRLSKSASRASV